MKAKIYITDYSTDKRLAFSGTKEFTEKNRDVLETFDKSDDVEANLINLHPDVTYHTFEGFGGGFTEAAAIAWSAMSDNKRAEFMKSYFDANDGIGYTFGRVHMNSCDFCVNDYCFVKDGDEDLSTFDISHDKEKMIPMIKEAYKYAQRLRLFASPWSPPVYMKTNDKIQGGHLDRKYYALWAKYFKKFAEEYKKAGVDINMFTMQNEPRHNQQWESCLYTPEEEAEFLGYLAKELADTDIKIICYDHCRERIYERAKAIFESSSGKFCDGIAHHHYSGDHYGEIEIVKKCYPEKIQIMSEVCAFDREQGIKTENAFSFGEEYGYDICRSLKAGLNYYCDWNITLDEFNGPCHHREDRELVDTPVYCKASSDELVYQPSYYYIGHFSKFIRPGAVCIGISTFSEKLDVCAFKNTDNSIVCVVLNKNDFDMEFYLRTDNSILPYTAKAHTIMTFIME